MKNTKLTTKKGLLGGLDVYLINRIAVIRYEEGSYYIQKINLKTIVGDCKKPFADVDTALEYIEYILIPGAINKAKISIEKAKKTLKE